MNKRAFAIGCSSTAMLAAGTIGLMAIPHPASARSTSGEATEPPAMITLTGVVRDFREHSAIGGHPDFEVSPNHGSGVYAGNIEYFIGDGPKPVFTGAGRKVLVPFRDASGRPIAPHLYNREYVSGTGESPNQTETILKDSDGVDAYRITWLSTTFNGDGTSTWVYRVDELATGKDLSHWNLALSEGQTVAEGTTAGYSLGVDGSTGFYGIKWDVTEGFTSGEFTIVLDGHYYGADMSCSVLAKGGNKPDHGTMFAPTSATSPSGSPFVTDSMLIDRDLSDQAGELGPTDSGGVQDGQSFFTWFRDKPGVNLSKQIDINLYRDSDGNYVFDSNTDPHYSSIGGFFPADNDLFGNSGDHNYHFTFEVHAEFTYDESSDPYFRFVGDDDVWVYIDGKLAIDLGGTHSAQEQYVDLDRMGLTDGETYRLDFFFAERHRYQSNCRIETNLALESVDIPTVSAAFD